MSDTADHDIGDMLAEHDFEVVTDWHRPAGADHEERFLRCSICGHGQREGRAPTGLASRADAFDPPNPTASSTAP